MVLLYHLTDKIDFRLDPRYAPTRNTTMGGEMKPGIFLSDHPDTWAQMYGYWQPWIVEFDVPEGVGNNGGGYGGEVYVLATDYPKMRLVRVVALDAWCRENFQDWGWTETEYGTEFDTEKPLPPGNWHMSGYGRFPYHGYRATDIRLSDPAWQTRYKARVKKYQRAHKVANASLKTEAVTTNKVSRVLGAKHPRAEKLTGRVRGYHTWRRGFRVSTDNQGRVVVEHQEGKNEEWAPEHVDRYHRTLADAGLHVTREQYPYGMRKRVRLVVEDPKTAAKPNRTCEQCGGAMPNRTHRQRNRKGQLVCDSCKEFNMPEWANSHSSLDLVAQSEMRRREAEAIVSISKVRRLHRESDMSRLAHDSGDNAILNHCPFCGSGAIVAGSDGSVTCDFCFSGQTEYMTREGLKTFAETAGTTQWVLTGDDMHHRSGRWVEAEIREFGEQPLMEVVLSRQGIEKRILATPEHRWFVLAGAKKKDRHREEITATLRSNHRLAHVRLAPLSVEADPEGIRMGFVYGDGTIQTKSNGQTYGMVSLWGPKMSVAKYFDDISRGYPAITPNGVEGLRYHSGMVGYHKTLPPVRAPRTYLMGWLSGYFAADGSVGRNGQVVLSSRNREALSFAKTVADLLGIGSFSISESTSRGGYDRDTAAPMFTLGLVRGDLTPSFFLREDHRANWEATQGVAERMGWTVKSVTPTGQVQMTYCAVVPETASFALADNIWVGNCHSAFTVQVQPAHPNMPQTVDGQPVTPPGMPGGEETELSAPTDPAVEESQDGVAANPLDDPQGPPSNGPVAPGKAPSKQPQAPGKADPQSNPGKGADGKKPNPFAKDPKSDAKPKGKSQPPWLKKKTFRTADGSTLSAEAYLAHLALEHADDRLAVLDTVRTANLQKRAAETCPACGGRGYHDVGGTTIDNPPDTEDCTLCDGAGTVSHLTAEEYRRSTEHQGSMRPFEAAQDRNVALDRLAHGVDCPRCGAWSDTPCKTRRNEAETQPHSERIDRAVRKYQQAKTSAQNLTRHQIPAHQVQAGDYLDGGGKVRVHNTHLRNDEVMLAWRLKGSKAPGVRSHHKDETVNVWRRTTEA